MHCACCTCVKFASHHALHGCLLARFAIEEDKPLLASLTFGINPLSDDEQGCTVHLLGERAVQGCIPDESQILTSKDIEGAWICHEKGCPNIPKDGTEAVIHADFENVAKTLIPVGTTITFEELLAINEALNKAKFESSADAA